MIKTPLKKAAPIQYHLKQKNTTSTMILNSNETLDPESIQVEVSEQSLSEQEKHAKKMRELELQQKYLEMQYQQNEEQRKKERHAKEMAQYITCTEILSFMWGLVWPSTSAKISLPPSSRELYLDKCDIVHPQLKKVQ